MFYGHYPYILLKVLNRHFEQIGFGSFQTLFPENKVGGILSASIGSLSRAFELKLDRLSVNELDRKLF